MQIKNLPVSLPYSYLIHLSLIILSIFMSMHATAQWNSDQTLTNLRKQIIELQHQSLYDSALLLANTALDNPNLKPADKQFLVYNKFISFHYQGKTDSAKSLLLQLESLVTQNDEAYVDYLFSKSLVLNNEGNYAQAIDLLLEIIVKFKEKININTLLQIYNSLGVNYKSIKDLTSAEYYFLQAWTLKNDVHDINSIVMLANNLGSLYNGFDKLDSALYFYNIATENLEKTNNQYLLAQNFLNVGNILEKQGKYPKAEAAFIQCLDISVKTGLEYGKLLSLLNLGNLARLQARFGQASSLLDSAFHLARTGSYIREESYILERKSWLARDSGDFESAYHLQLMASNINDSLLSERVRKDAAEMQIKYETTIKEKELVELKLKNQRLISLVSISLFGIIILAILIFWIVKIKNKLHLEKNSIAINNEALIEDIKSKDIELASMALELIQFKKVLEIEKNNQGKAEPLTIGEVERNDDVDSNKLSILNRNFEARIINENKNFFLKILDLYPNLSPAELRLAAYLKLNLTTKEIAHLQNKSVRTIEATRYSLRKKLGINSRENLSSFLLGFDDGLRREL